MLNFRKYTLREAAVFIENSESALIVCHVNPDADTVGSALALKKMFTLNKRRAKVVCPSEIPDRIAFLAEGEDLSYEENEEASFEKVICVDVASPAQLGGLRHLAEKTDLAIDHHASGEVFAPNLVDPLASAAGEIVFGIYRIPTERGSLENSAEICRFLFAAISSDTGSFKYSNTAPSTFFAASLLSEEIGKSDDGGMKTDEISRLLHDTVTEQDLKINSLVTEKTVLLCNGSISAAIITKEDMENEGFSEKDFGGAIDVLRKLRGVLVSFILREKEDDPGTYKISARANTDINVAEVCEKFGGGGHMRAAGGSLRAENAEKAFEIASEAFSASVVKFKNQKV